ncbi:MAG TPA: hypothetical protein VGK34_02810 [Armatimonadota bacterium]
MSQERQKTRKEIYDRISRVVDDCATFGMVVGGGAFICAAAYLLWGVFQGNLASVSMMATEQADRIVNNIVFGGKLLAISGVVLSLCSAVKQRGETLVGYALLAWGCMLCWGLPILVNSTLATASINSNIVQGMLTAYIVNSFRTVGIASLVLSIPFVLIDFWQKLVGARRDYPQRQATTVSKEPVAKEKALIPLFCWQMPYCREHLRGHCSAYQSRKPCWLLKSGCYCDEEMLLRAMKKSPAQKVELLKEEYVQQATKPGNLLTDAQKRQRCRQCFIYSEHQKQKYRILSPFAFPVVAALMWMFYGDIIRILNRVLTGVDQFASAISFAPTEMQSALGKNLMASAGATSTAEYILLGCIGLVVASYLLRGLEYLIFELQV